MVTLLQIDSLAMTTSPIVANTIHSNIWMWVALSELVVIIILLSVIIYKKSDIYGRKAKILAEEPDFNNLFNSAFNAEPLYKELSRICHPDRFAPDEKKMAVADDIFQRVSKNRNNIKVLQELKAEISAKLL